MRRRTQHLRLDATIPYHYTTKPDYITLAKNLLFLNAFHKEKRKRRLEMIDPHALTEKKTMSTHSMAMNYNLAVSVKRRLRTAHCTLRTRGKM